MVPAKCVEDARRFYEERYAAVYARPGLCVRRLPESWRRTDRVHQGGDGRQLRFRLCAAKAVLGGRDFVTEAGRAVVERVRADGLPYITATHDVNNPAAGAVMRRLGMKYCYSYKEQWQPKTSPSFFRLYQLHFDGRDDCVYSKYRSCTKTLLRSRTACSKPRRRQDTGRRNFPPPFALFVHGPAVADDASGRRGPV